MTASAPRLTRAHLAASGTAHLSPPVRIVHLGAGAFHRAHQAWYTAHATDAAHWGIAAFTGRDDAVARRLAPQDGLFTLVERGADRDRFEIVGSIARVHAAAELSTFLTDACAPTTAVITLTVTEAGYQQRPDGTLDLQHPDVAADVTALLGGAPAQLRTPTARLLLALTERERTGAGPLTVVPCDNLPENGSRLRTAVRALAEAADRPDPVRAASFVTTSVDRITPRTTAGDIAVVEAATGWRDESPVVTEPFSDWVLCGDFAAGRPDWESAGARIVGDIAPFERRKLLMLNGAHLVLAFGGLLRGHETVAQAMADAACRRELDVFWDEAARAVGTAVETAQYRAALIGRFHNRRIEHRLAQIASDTVTKLRLRVLPVIEHERRAGRGAAGAAAVVSTWADCVRAELITVSGAPDLETAIAGLTANADPDLARCLFEAAHRSARAN